MKKEILAYLKMMELEKDIEILFAVESGSRAWGFASKDSDYDIRFVYKQKTENYLSLYKKKDSMEFITPEKLDGNGWDVKKAVLLLQKSNASLLNWLYSPIVYMNRGKSIEVFQCMIESGLNEKVVYYHYRNMCSSYLEKIIKESYTIKELFYALRTLLIQKWMVEIGGVPPVTFTSFLKLLPRGLEFEVVELMRVKESLSENSFFRASKRMESYLSELYSTVDQKKEGMKIGKYSKSDLENYFIRTVL